MHEYSDNYDHAKIRVRDNGPGMSKEELERNLRAGYSGKDPLNEMGLFGMGFNIASARLGNQTRVKTTRTGDEQWAVATIDFRDLERRNSFEVGVEFEEKDDSNNHGTEIVIGQLNEIARTLRRKQNMPEDLGDWYTPVLERENVKITLDGDELETRPACIWDKERSVEIGGEEFKAKVDINKKVGEGFYCKECWTWWEKEFLTDDGEPGSCPSCEGGGNIVHRDQRIWGWLGIQRFFDRGHYGIDLVRNGRIIEKHDKDLFYWEGDDGTREKEYPIDTTHWGGRIVGELHIDFVPVTHTKDGYKKSNDRWEKVREAIRGEPPLRPQKARDLGYEPDPNRSPLAKLYKGYRTGNKVGKKRLVPGQIDKSGEPKGDNSRPKEWAKKFWNGEKEYQDDTKWWELVVKAEEALRGSEVDTNQSNNNTNNTDETGESDAGGDTDSDSDGFDLDPNSGSDSGTEQGNDNNETNSNEDSDSGTEQTLREQEENEGLSGTYGLDEIDEPDIQFNVYRLTAGSLNNGPVEVERRSWDKRKIVYDSDHEFFSEFGHDPIDTVLLEAASTFRSRMDDPGNWRQTRLFADLQSKYRDDERISPEGLAARANERLRQIKQTVAAEKYDLNGYEIDESVEEDARQSVWEMESGGEDAVEEILTSSAFLEHVSHQELKQYFEANPGQFFDDTVWGRPYEELGSEQIRERVVTKFSSYLDDVVMLANEATNYDFSSLPTSKRIEIERAAQSLKLLEEEAI